MTLEEFKKLNAQKGYYWFSPASMGFFGCNLHEFDESTGYFITSEVGPVGDSPRRYSIRKADFETGDVETIGEFHKYKTHAAAMLAMRKLPFLNSKTERQS